MLVTSNDDLVNVNMFQIHMVQLVSHFADIFGMCHVVILDVHFGFTLLWQPYM
jgi:hypothetical protein